jgi:hypothetical protein
MLKLLLASAMTLAVVNGAQARDYSTPITFDKKRFKAPKPAEPLNYTGQFVGPIVRLNSGKRVYVINPPASELTPAAPGKEWVADGATGWKQQPKLVKQASGAL